MNWQAQLKGDPLPWLLDQSEPGIRYLALRHLFDLPAGDPQLLQARRAAHTQGPIATILDNMQPEGYWSEAGAGYYPKYFSTVWSLILLAQLGASIDEDERIKVASNYMLDHGFTRDGIFSTNGAPSGTADCMQGNLCHALVSLGGTDPRLEKAFEWMARTVTAEGIAPMEEKKAPVRYYAGKCGPTFACGSNNKLPCAWGGVKVMLAFSAWPVEKRTPLIQRAIQHGVDFFFSVDPATAAYPNGWAPKPSGNWWKFGFPVFYVTDLLQVAEALVGLGYAHDPRLATTLALIQDKQDEHGRWMMEYDYSGKTWVDFGPKKVANKWVTLRALRLLKEAA